MSQTDKQYRLERNKDFGFYQVLPTPSQDEITKFYAEEFYSNEYKRFNNSTLEVQLLDKEFHDAHREDICAVIQQISSRPIAGQRILDVGCGWAQTLLYLKDKGALCYGFDPAPEAVAYAQSHGKTGRHG
jgi:2-polyprenyl-3-methyl-5-hydroxy-6-metoxy-1,4-benzoquinol methylase